MKGLHHVGITVKDLDASISFYHDVLGLPFSNEPSPWFEGEELGPAVGVPGAALRQVSLQLGDTILELLEYKSPPSETMMPLKSNNRGASHVGFLVDDIAAKKAELEAKGVEFYGPVNFVDEGVWQDGAGFTSPIRTDIRSSSWRSRTSTRTNGAPESRPIWLRDLALPAGRGRPTLRAPTTRSNIDLRPCADPEKAGMIPSSWLVFRKRVSRR